jgi:hypothetical protein
LTANPRSWGVETLTREIVVWLSILLRYVQLIVFDVLIVEDEGSINISEMLIEPVDGTDHQIGAIQVLLDLNLNENSACQ